MATITRSNDADTIVPGFNTLGGDTPGDGADSILGLGGNDVLDGGEGIDRLLGGAGNDTYVVETIGDLAIEAANAGLDTVRTTLASYTLRPEVEILVGLASTGQALAGNTLANVITGGTGADTLFGNRGADTLTGGAGFDRLVGGADGDRYVVGAGDVVAEFLYQGQDTVIATAGTSWVLGGNVEALVLEGATLVSGVGNALANVLLGNGLNNVLLGGAGADTLTGGLGADVFRIGLPTDSAPLAPDRVTDFAFAQGDRIDLRFIDTNTHAPANEAFVHVGAAAFAGLGAASAGHLHVIADGAGRWQALGDTNGDGTAELRIDITSATAPVAGWFLA